MRKSILVLSILLSLLVLGAAAPTAAAQQETPTAGENSTENNDVRVSIDENTDVVSAELQGDTAVLTIRSDVRQRIQVATVTVEPGPIPRPEVFVFKADQERTIRVPIEIVDGYGLVQVFPGDSRGHGLRLAEPSDMLPGEPSGSDAVIAGATVFGVFAVAIPGVWLGWRRSNGGPKRVF